tara:strand:+ start:301 stop:711 length:411 start_codon:yes stop_codon:yes gene_type:complete
MPVYSAGMIIPEFGLITAIAYALTRRRGLLRAIGIGGAKAEAARADLAVVLERHLVMCCWDIVGINSPETAREAFARGLEAADVADIADMALKHAQREGSAMRVAAAVLAALRAAGGNIERLKPLPPPPNTHHGHW